MPQITAAELKVQSRFQIFKLQSSNSRQAVPSPGSGQSHSISLQLTKPPAQPPPHSSSRVLSTCCILICRMGHQPHRCSPCGHDVDGTDLPGDEPCRPSSCGSSRQQDAARFQPDVRLVLGKSLHLLELFIFTVCMCGSNM